MVADVSTIHASAVLIGPKAVLIRGPSGSGKSMLAWNLMMAAEQGLVSFARLVADDRAHVERHSGRLLVRPAQTLAGMIEIHGLGIRRIEFEPIAVVGLIIDLEAADAARSPDAEARIGTINDITLPRLPVAAGIARLAQVLAVVHLPPAGN
jgi:serine kinase of HPr protein (carbohydrate metabolism regulator)